MCAVCVCVCACMCAVCMCVCRLVLLVPREHSRPSQSGYCGGSVLVRETSMSYIGLCLYISYVHIRAYTFSVDILLCIVLMPFTVYA